MKSFQDLTVWQKAHQLTLNVYEITKCFPSEEKFGLTAQIRRSCSSVATNIVEGFKRVNNRDESHFLNMAESSLEETKYHLILGRDLKYIEIKNYEELKGKADEVGRMLNAYRAAVLRRSRSEFAASLNP